MASNNYGYLPPFLEPFVGDTGNGGQIGLVPAPAAGDAADSKFLSASGGWGIPSGTGGGVTTVGALDGGVQNANFLYISGVTIYAQSATALYPGVINIFNQTFSGVKTFNDGAATKYLAVGASYLATTPPTNGAIIQGNLSVGVSTNSAAFHLKAGGTEELAQYTTGTLTGIASRITASDTIGSYMDLALQPTGGASLVAAMQVIKPLIDASLATSATVATVAGLIITAGSKAAGTVTNAVNLSIDAPTYGSSSNAAAYLANATIGYTNYTPPTDGLTVKGRITSGSTTPSPYSFLDIFAPTSVSYMASFTGTIQGNDGFYTLGFYVAPILNPTGGASSAIGFQINPGFKAPTASTITVAKVIEVYGGWSTNIGTISDAYHLYIDGSGGAGTISRGYGLWVAQPTMATLNVCAYFGGGISVGYLATATPTNGAIIAGRVAIGANAVSDVSQLTVTATTGANTGLKVNGTVDGVVSNTGYALNLASTLIPTSGAGTVIGSSIKVSFVAPSAQTITYAIGQYIYPTVSSNVGTISNLVNCLIDAGTPGAGTITKAIGLRVEIPTAATTNICASFANGIAVGYDLIGLPTPPNLGAIFAGRVGIGYNSATFFLEVNATSTSDGVRVKGASTNVQSILNNTSGTSGSRSFALTNNSGFAALLVQKLSDADAFSANMIGMFSNSGLSVGSTYATLTPPANGVIVEGIVGIGTNAPNTQANLTVTPGARYNILVNGTYSPVMTSFSAYDALDVLPNYSPSGAGTDFSSYFRAVNSQPNFAAPSTKTLTGALTCFYAGPTLTGNAGTLNQVTGYYYDGGAALTGTVSSSYGAYLSAPNAGTVKVALYAANAAFGYTGVTPPTNGAIIAGVVGIGTSSVTTGAELQVNGPIYRQTATLGGPVAYNNVIAAQEGLILYRDVNNNSAMGVDGTGALWISCSRVDSGIKLYTGATPSVALYANANGGISVGNSYGSTTPPANGAIIQGILAVGTSAPDTAGLANIQCGGTKTNTNGGFAYSIITGTTFTPTSGAVGDLRGISSQCTFNAASGQTVAAAMAGFFNITPNTSGNTGTITNAYTLFVAQGSAPVSGTVTNGYGLYCAVPAFGTNKICGYFEDGVNIGVSGVVPPSKGLLMYGTLVVGDTAPRTDRNIYSNASNGLQWTNLQLNGILNKTASFITGTDQAGLYNVQTLAPNVACAFASGSYHYMQVDASSIPSTATLNLYCGMYIHGGGLTAGTVTTAVGLLVQVPNFGTTRICAEFTGNVKFDANITGAGSAALGANCPASTVSAPYTWIRCLTNDGSTVYVPCWK